MAKKAYWLGKGLLKVGGKLVETGKPFNPDDLDKDRLKQWKKDGLVGEAPFQQSDSPNNDNELLQGRIKELEAKAIEDGDKIAGLELELEAAGDGDCKKCQEKDTDIEEKAALIKEQKTEIKALKKAAKEAAKK
jgi:hypothetical protein